MFEKYNSIENSYREEFLARIRSHGFWDLPYVVQEKVHGANISFWTLDGVNFNAGKRTAALSSKDKFNNYQVVLERHLDAFKSMWESLKETYPDLRQMTLFKELIGGSFPHKDVPRDPTASKVQKGIFYSPHNEFYAFDVRINANTYLGVKEANALFEKGKLLYAKTLLEGSLKECLTYPNDFDSTIPAELGLPLLSPNVCEGVVIRPLESCFLNSGKRVLLKNKNEKWSEKIKTDKKARLEAPVSEKVKVLMEIIQAYITPNRFQNLLSKTGPITKSDFGKTLGLLSKDVVDDFKKDNLAVFSSLDKKDQKLITKSITKSCVALLNGHLYG